jgi:hypothetical protein
MERRRGDRRTAPRRAGDRRPMHGYRNRWLPLRPRRRRRLVLAATLVAVLAVPVWRVVTRDMGLGAGSTPPELIGVWVTAAPGYADRALEFTRASVILHTDETHFTVHRVLSVRRSTNGLFLLYHVEYQDLEGATTLDFRYVTSPQPLIRLEHLPYVWRRTTRR